MRHISCSVLLIYTRRLRVQLSVNLPKELQCRVFVFMFVFKMPEGRRSLPEKNSHLQRFQFILAGRL